MELENKYHQLKERKENLREVCHHIVTEFELALSSHVKQVVKALRSHVDEVVAFEEISREAENELEKLHITQQQIDHIQKVINEFSCLSQQLFPKLCHDKQQVNANGEEGKFTTRSLGG